MHKRSVRFSIVALLAAVGIGAAYVVWISHQQFVSAVDRSRRLNVALDAVLADVSELGAAQQAYVVPGQSDGPWITRVSSLLQGLYDRAAAVQGLSPSGGSTVRSMQEALDALVAIDSHAREYLRGGEELMASDLVFNEARDSLASIAAAVDTLRAEDAAASGEALREASMLQASVLGAAAGLWLIGLLLLTRVPRAKPVTPPIEAAPQEELPEAPTPPAAAASSIDWPRAARVCGELARMTDGAAVPALFAEVARAVDAPGAILWLGAGEQLFAAAAHGYEARVLGRLGPIDRAADNATAAAWRTGTLQLVPGDAAANGAVVAPLVGQGGGSGVLAVEVRAGRESDPAVQSVIAMLAAQLGSVAAAWPAASTQEERMAAGR